MSLILQETYGCFRAHSDDFWPLMSIHTTLYPEESYMSCAAILTMNLASPEWITVGCFEKLKPPLLCEFTDENQTRNKANRTGDLSIFHSECVVRERICVLFVLHKSTEANIVRRETITFEHVKEFENLFGAVSQPFPPILCSSGPTAFVYKRFSAFYHYSKIHVPEGLTNALQIYSLPPNIHQIGGNLFQCDNSGAITTIFTYYHRKDNCDFSHVSQSELSYWNDQHDCSQLYLIRSDGSCDLYKEINFLSFPIKNMKTSILYSVNKGHHTNKFGCNGTHLLQCGLKEPYCYNASHICVYTKLKSGVLVPCQQGEHMQKCASFECNMMFKCPRYYCLPWHFVCDGKWDCPAGLDENVTACSSVGHCRNLMRCQGSQICLHLGVVCDGNVQCPYGDDETFCSLHNITCPNVCQCLTFALVCTSVFQWNFAQGIIPHYAIFLTHSSPLMIEAFATLLHQPVVLVISNNQLSAICGKLTNMHLCFHLDAGFNKITSVDDYCFPTPSQLIHLKLNNNNIVQLFSHSFSNLGSLKFINLSSNSLISFAHIFLPESPYICLIDFSKTQLKNVQEDLLLQIGHPIILSDNLFLCCWKSSKHNHRRCAEVKIVCNHFTGNKNITIFALVFSVFVVATNIGLVLMKLKTLKKNSKKFTPQMICLHATETLHGIGLAFLYLTDFHKEELFAYLQTEPTFNIFCAIHITISSIYTGTMILLLVLVSLTRMMAVKYPLQAKQNTKKINSGILYFTVSTTLLAISIILGSQVFGSSIPFKTCSFQIVSETTPFWPRLFTSLLLVPHGIALCFMASFYHIAWCNLKTSGANLKKHISKQKSVSHVLLHLVILWIANFLCWVPGGFIQVVCVATSCPEKLLLWITTVLSTINPIVHPIATAAKSFGKGQ